MAISNIVTASPTAATTCEVHRGGDGRECEWTYDADIHSTNTMDGASTLTVGR